MTPNDSAQPRLSALNVLVVEDEFLLACMLEEELRALGCGVVGPYGDRASATAASRSEDFNFAILDINLGGDMVYPLADDLAARAVPFIFLTGYGMLNLPERFRSRRRLAKPYNPAELMRELQRAARESK